MTVSITQPCVRSQSLRFAKYLIVLVGLILCVVCLACTSKEKTNVLDAPKTKEALPAADSLIKKENANFEGVLQERQCKQDEDCILTKKSCCSCDSGGEQIAINRNLLKDFQQRRDATCADRLCPAVINDSPNCKAKETLCVNGTCEVKLLKGLKKIKIEPITEE